MSRIAGHGPRPLSRQRSQWRPLPAAQFLPVGGQALGRNVSDGVLFAIVADEPAGWHLSVSFRDHRGQYTRYPTWDELAHARYELLPDDIDVVMHLPPPDQYVAVHDTTFHLHEHPERTP
jgi:hypothetical protein